MAVTLHYFRSEPPNFGDELNALIWPGLLPELAQSRVDGVLVGIGTILDSKIPQAPNVFVFGSGAGLAPLPTGFGNGTCEIAAVRGPLTAMLAGLPPDLAVTDPALLLRAMYPQLLGQRNRAGAAETLFVPHYTTARDPAWRRACARAGIRYVDPTADCLTILKRIASARLVIAEAMHAAIVADAFRVPWVPVASTPYFSTFKWVDWTLSLQVPFRLTVLPAVSTRHLFQRAGLRLFAERCLVRKVNTSGRESDLRSEAVISLLRETAKRFRAPRSGALFRMRMKAAALHQRVVDPLVARLSGSLFRGPDNRMEQRMARLLSELAATAGYRSTDEISAARLHTLQERLEWLRGRLEPGLRRDTVRAPLVPTAAGRRRTSQ
jgi:succinoglycan biosynthesis protein ExoV